MINIKKNLYVFGGFHDNLRDYKYFNDIYCFNMATYTWSKLDTSGIIHKLIYYIHLVSIKNLTRYIL